MDLETLIVAVFRLVDDFVRDLCHDRRLRQRGPTPVLADSEVLTVEIVGEFLGLDTDRGLHTYFRRHYGHLFPRLREVHRTTFARQAANLWVVKHALWRRLAAMAVHDPAVTLVDRAGSSGRRNTSTKEVAVDPRRRRSDRCGRGALRSPGRPSVARREDRRQFWVLIAAGRSSEDAAAGVGVAPALGTRWFREAGGMPPS